MKKVLVITYGWPPKGGVGVMRTVKFVKYLPSFGWTPIVITTNESAKGSAYGNEDADSNISAEVMRTGYKEALGMLPDRIRQNMLLPDMQVGWFNYAVEEILRLVERERVDVIFSTSPPETAHLIADSVKKRTGLPWVADLRDLWSEDLFRPRNPFIKSVLRAMERDILRGADIVVTVTDKWAQSLAASAAISKEKIRIITNGYDEEDFKITAGRPDKFTISYTGKLHRTYQDPEPFFRVLTAAASNGDIDREKVEIRFNAFGHECGDIEKSAKKYGIDDIVKNYGRVSYPAAVKAMISSTILLFIGWSGKGGDSWHSAKIFDYIGSGRPILCFGAKRSAAARLIEELRCGTVAGSERELYDALTGYYREYLDKGSAELKEVDSNAVASCTRFNKTKELALLFDGLCMS